MTKTTAPYGTWVSPVSVELMTEAAIALASLSVDGTDLYWLEARPRENGRAVLCRRRADGVIEDLTSAPFNVGSRVHEYGGGAYAVAAGCVVFSERASGNVFLIEAGGGAPRKIETPDGCRYADFEFDLPRRRVLAVREDHRGRPPTDPKAAIVALAARRWDGNRSRRGSGFPKLAAPFAGRQDALLDRLGSSQYALGRHKAFCR